MSKVQKKTPIRKPKRPVTKFLFRLFISGNAPQSVRAILNLKRICEEHLPDRYELEIIDIYKNPLLAKAAQIIAAPTLIKIRPRPSHRLIGDLSDESKVLRGLNITPVGKSLESRL